MRFTTTLVGCTSLGLHVLYTQAATIPVAGLARRGEHVARQSDMSWKRHEYNDELAKRHDYGIDADQAAWIQVPWKHEPA